MRRKSAGNPWLPFMGFVATLMGTFAPGVAASRTEPDDVTAPHAAVKPPDASMSVEVVATRPDPRLPIGAPASIVIRYSSENAAARQRATDLARGLSEQGLAVADLIASPERIASSTVSYFYAEDRPDAEVAARGLGPAWKSVQQRLPAREPFPRPGTMELSVAGP